MILLSPRRKDRRGKGSFQLFFTILASWRDQFVGLGDETRYPFNVVIECRCYAFPCNCRSMASFSSVEVSCVISSPLAMVRSRRRMILPERVLGRLSA